MREVFMKQCIAMGAVLLAALVASSGSADEGLKSGLAVGKTPTPFNPLHVTGPTAGQKLCLV
jgi:hypothetical protein